MAGKSGSSGTGGAAGTGTTSSGRWVGGYYVGYQEDLYPPDAIDWNGLSHLVIGRVTPKNDGSLDTTYDIDATNGPKLASELTMLAHQNGKAAIVMLGGAGVHDQWVSAASSKNRDTLVQNLVNLQAVVGFDGFDIDWEPIDSSDEAPLKALAQALKAAAPSAQLTIPVTWSSSDVKTSAAFYGELGGLFDQINIMSYGMADAWEGWQSWHSSALTGDGSTTPSSVALAVKAYRDAGVPAAKLGVGIGFYGSCWSPPVSGPLQDIGGSQVVASDNDMSFATIMQSYYSDSARKWDDSALVPYLSFSKATGPAGCTFVSYEDAESIRAKMDWVTQQGLGGAIVWTINQGYVASAPAGERDPLMEALATFLEQ
jgi:chitinase